MKKIILVLSICQILRAMALFGYTEGTVRVADVSIKPDLKNVTYYKAKGLSITGGVTYRWVQLTPQEIQNILKVLVDPKIDSTRRINHVLIREFANEYRDNKVLLMVLTDFSGRKIKRVIKVLKKEKPGLVDKLAVVLPEVGGY